MYGSAPLSDYLLILENLDYKKFAQFKDNFFKNLTFQWLICGHLTQERALHLCDIALDSLNYRPINRDDILLYQQLVKLPSRSVHNFDKGRVEDKDLEIWKEVNSGDNPNPNSCCFSYFQSDTKTYKNAAVMRILVELLKEPCFNVLRTQE